MGGRGESSRTFLSLVSSRKIALYFSAADAFARALSENEKKGTKFC